MFRLSIKFVLIGLLLIFSEIGKASDSLAHENVLHIIRATDVQKFWDYHFIQNNIAIEPDKTYRLSFVAKASAPTQLIASAKIAQPPWKNLDLNQKVPVDTEWERFVFDFSGDGAVPNKTRLSFILADTQPVEVWLDEVSIVAIDTPDGEGINILSNSDFENGLDDWEVKGKQGEAFQVEIQFLDDSSSKP
ncbi:MAG: carbohydrate binding domain-containing protein [Chthoniobacterales bacterium]